MTDIGAIAGAVTSVANTVTTVVHDANVKIGALIGQNAANATNAQTTQNSDFALYQAQQQQKTYTYIAIIAGVILLVMALILKKR